MNQRFIASRVAAAVLGVLSIWVGPMPVWADAPPGRYQVDAAAGTVLDTATGRTWQQVDMAGKADWVNGEAYCANLTLAALDWRLPSIEELESITDVNRTSQPAIDEAAFPNTSSAYYWSTTESATSRVIFWAVSFANGHSGMSGREVPYHVRCVR